MSYVSVIQHHHTAVCVCVRAVAQGRRINFEAYVSDKLVQKIHKLLWTQPNGIVVENFLNVYQVSKYNHT